MMKSRIKYITLMLVALLPVILISCDSQEISIYNDSPTTYYVSSQNKNEDNDGLSRENPIATIEQVNSLDLKPGDTVLFERGSVFRGNLQPVSGSQEQRITYASYGEGELPVIMGSVSIFSNFNDFENLGGNVYGAPSSVDIGNVIFNEGQNFGVKKFQIYELSEPLDYYSDRNSGVLFIYADEQLINFFEGRESEYYSVEFCVTENVVDLDNKHDLIFEDLSIKNGGAHGFGGSNIYRVTINGCEISYMGGGFLHYNDDKEPVRYGNGFELFNTGSYIEVTDCIIFEIFDTAVTNQGKQNNGGQSYITYSDNTIYNCGMSAYELWLQGNNTSMTNIKFTDNDVYNIGYGFSATQGRQDNYGLGYFVINFGNDAVIENLSISDNTFDTVFNYHDYSALLLNIEIDTPIYDDVIYSSFSDNEVTGNRYHTVYTIDGEIYFLD